MPSIWVVRYKLEPGVLYAAGPLEFVEPQVTLTLAANEIVGISHQLTLPDQGTGREAIKESRRELDIMLLALRYRQLKAVKYTLNALRISPSGGPVTATARGRISTGPLAVRVPDSLWRNPREARLATWLELAGDAREATSPATALRLYYFILEDLRDSPALGQILDEVSLSLFQSTERFRKPSTNRCSQDKKHSHGALWNCAAVAACPQV